MLRLNIALLLLSTPVLAAESAATGEPSLSRLLLALLFILTLIFVAAWIVRRAPLRMSQGAIRIIATQSLGAREKLLLVEVGNQQLLIGVTAQQINHLQTLQEKVPVDASSGQGMRFADALTQVLKGQKG